MKCRAFLFGIPLLAALNAAMANEGNKDVWLLVETQSHVLKVMEGDRPVEVFEKIAIGRRGAGYHKARGDDKTPLGNYRIGWINDSSRFHRFFGFSYPNRANAERAFQTGLIGAGAYESILRADSSASVPPQNTPLGGQIGIHGLGSGNLDVHLNFDWTHGCIAMTNQQIDRLSSWVKKGTLVVVREISQNNGGKFADFAAN